MRREQTIQISQRDGGLNTQTTHPSVTRVATFRHFGVIDKIVQRQVVGTHRAAKCQITFARTTNLDQPVFIWRNTLRRQLATNPSEFTGQHDPTACLTSAPRGQHAP